MDRRRDESAYLAFVNVTGVLIISDETIKISLRVQQLFTSALTVASGAYADNIIAMVFPVKIV